MSITTKNQTYNEKTDYCEKKIDYSEKKIDYSGEDIYYCGEEQEVIRQLLELLVEKQQENYNLTQKLNKIQSIVQSNTDYSQYNDKS